MTEADIYSIMHHSKGKGLSFLYKGNQRYRVSEEFNIENCRRSPSSGLYLFTHSLPVSQPGLRVVNKFCYGWRWLFEQTFKDCIPSSAGVWIGCFHPIFFSLLNIYLFAR